MVNGMRKANTFTEITKLLPLDLEPRHLLDMFRALYPIVHDLSLKKSDWEAFYPDKQWEITEIFKQGETYTEEGTEWIRFNHSSVQDSAPLYTLPRPPQ
jgi:hypothetical protein